MLGGRAFLGNRRARWPTRGRVSPQHAAAGSNPDPARGLRVPEAIQSVASNASQYNPSQQVSSAPPTPQPSELESRPPPEPPAPAVSKLISNYKPTATVGQCSTEAAALVVASGRMLSSVGAMVAAAPTMIAEVPVILGFIGNAAALGAAAAVYANCKDEAAAKSKAK
jgi:hypothetical protein